MLRFVVRRLLLLIPILIGLSILVFLWIRALPGSPATALLGERATAEQIEAINEQYGLNDPIWEQYWRYIQRLASFDFGDSITTRRPVFDEFLERFPATIELALGAMFFSVLVGIPLGFLAAKRYGSFLDHSSLFASLLGISIPIFVLAIILKYIFAVRLGWLPTVGRISVLIDLEHPTNFYVLDAILTGNWEALWDAIQHLILPAIALGTIPLAIIARITRASVLDVQNEDYVRTARAKGVAPRTVDGRHILRNAMLPIVTIIGLQAGLLLSGAVLTETVFAWPGVGTWLVERDRSSRLRGPAGRDPLHRRRLRPRQPARRPLVRAAQPADPALLSVAEIEAREAQLESGRGRSLARRLVASTPEPGCARRLRHRRDVSSSSRSSRRCSRPRIRAFRTSRGSAAAAARARRSTTGSGSTRSGGTSSRASSTALATRS